ncbi:MAG TPA: L-threonylcarbamoyladenylate synthase [Acidimicrobiales bacterium]|nr:L-threonylcarbamoyladenylate synthase [Acidimicrobiales bacterium]
MAIVEARGDPPPDEAIKLAVKALGSGQIICVPTDTVYGLAADPFRTGASDRLFRLKGRPRSVELPVLVSGVEQALALCTAVPAAARSLMERFWPGPLTLVLPRRPDLEADLGEDDATIGIRCPAHPVPLAVCSAVGPIATSSANRHGEPPLTTALEVLARLGPDVALVLDAGCCSAPSSSVVDCTGQEPRMLRAGALSWEEMAQAATGR